MRQRQQPPDLRAVRPHAQATSLQNPRPLTSIFSSSGFSRDAGYEGGSDDGCSIPDSELYTLSPPPSLHTGHVSRVSGDSDQTSSRSAASIQLHARSPVQRQAAPVYNACNGDTMIQNMAAIIADPAPMQVRQFASMLSYIFMYQSSMLLDEMGEREQSSMYNNDVGKIFMQ